SARRALSGVDGVIYEREGIRHTTGVEPRLGQCGTKELIVSLVHHARKRLFHQSETLRQGKPLRFSPAHMVTAPPADHRKTEPLGKRHRPRATPLAAVAIANYHEGPPRDCVAPSTTRRMRQGCGKR